ncbi:DUF1559 domain-containing protein [Gimesia maris]|uniref:DUF1559 family PulG-like putative transporter n=1 Tax=Gimesia maris TaxID=122 RepID=UPI00241E88B7|nr:DUF1559 domain-containing protein [Gimesia maris]|tara:strand:+ start:16749 stop:17669 length:921 start_codon:yes stop_codon:yes gene_type:complete
MENWYVRRENETAGPLTLARMRELIQEDKLQKSDLVRRGEVGNLITAAHVLELFPDSGSSQPATQATETAPRKIYTAFISGLLIAVLATILAIGTFFWLKKVEAEHRAVSKKHLKQIGLAMKNYHDTFSTFPPGGTETPDGKPYLSWQTAILPYIKQAPLYNKVNFSRPWNHPQNHPLFKSEIDVYLNPAIEQTVSAEGLALTHYAGNKLVLKTNGFMNYRHIKDGTANTILAVEVAENFKPWGDPTNTVEPAKVFGSGKKSSFTGGNHLLISDGSVRFVTDQIDPELLKALSTPTGRERMDQFKD